MPDHYSKPFSATLDDEQPRGCPHTVTRGADIKMRWFSPSKWEETKLQVGRWCVRCQEVVGWQDVPMVNGAAKAEPAPAPASGGVDIVDAAQGSPLALSDLISMFGARMPIRAAKLLKGDPLTIGELRSVLKAIARDHG